MTRTGKRAVAALPRREALAEVPATVWGRSDPLFGDQFLELVRGLSIQAPSYALTSNDKQVANVDQEGVVVLHRLRVSNHSVEQVPSTRARGCLCRR